MLSCAPRSSGFCGVMTVKGLDLNSESDNIWVRRSSRYLVKSNDFFRRALIDVSLNISSEATMALRSRALGLESWYPAAPGLGMNSAVSFVSTRHKNSLKVDILLFI